MGANWDLYLLDPLLIVVGLFLMILMKKKEKGDWRWAFFYVEVISIWIANGFIIKVGAAQLGLLNSIGSTGAILLGVFAVSALFAIILKPIASFITRKFKSRKSWLWIGIGTTILSLILMFLFKNVSSPIAIVVVCAILVGFSMASQSIYFLFFNEQFYYRMFPILTVVKVGAMVTLGTFIGVWIFSMTSATQGTGEWTNKTNPNIAILICLIATLVSLVFSIFNKEDKNFNSGFNAHTKSLFLPATKKVITLLLITSLILGIIYGITQNQVIQFYMVAALVKSGVGVDKIYQVIRIYEHWYIIPQFLVGFLIYKFILQKIGFMQMILIAIGITLVLSVLMAFIHNPYFYVIANFLLGLCFTQVFYIIFGMAIMWNYRANGFPITGGLTAITFIGSYANSTISVILKESNVGVYKYAHSISDIIASPNIDQILNKSTSTVTILFAVIFALSAAYFVWYLFVGKIILGEYVKIMDMVNKMKSVEQSYIMNKIKNKMEL